METRYKNIFHELLNMILMPWSIAFTLYFIIVIIVINGLGTLTCPFKYNQGELVNNISQNLSIYSIAIFAPAFFSLLLQLIQDQIQHKVSFVIICIGFVIFEFFAIPTAYQGDIIMASACTIISWLFWIAANRNNEFLNDESFDVLIKKDTNKHGKNWD